MVDLCRCICTGPRAYYLLRQLQTTADPGRAELKANVGTASRHDIRGDGAFGGCPWTEARDPRRG